MYPFATTGFVTPIPAGMAICSPFTKRLTCAWRWYGPIPLMPDRPLIGGPCPPFGQFPWG